MHGDTYPKQLSATCSPALLRFIPYAHKSKQSHNIAKGEEHSTECERKFVVSTRSPPKSCQCELVHIFICFPGSFTGEFLTGKKHRAQRVLHDNLAYILI
jgi:hypothetical protein